jgi:hypothetical protein
MNLHACILAQAAFLERPHSRAQLYIAVGPIEERFSVLRERQRTQSVPNTSSGGGSRGREMSRNRQVNSRSPRCWNCGRVGHVRRHCHQNSSSSGKRAGSWRSSRHRAETTVAAFRKAAAVPPPTLLWFRLKLKLGELPALIDTGAQFSCIRSDVVEYLYMRGESSVFTSCSVTYVLADVRRDMFRMPRSYTLVYCLSRGTTNSSYSMRAHFLSSWAWIFSIVPR